MKITKNNIYQGSRERQSVYDTFYEENRIKKPVIIFSHGFKGFKDHGCFDLMAEFWAEHNFAFIINCYQFRIFVWSGTEPLGEN